MIGIYLQCLLLALVFMGSAFLLSLYTRTNTVVDIFWGLGYILIAWYTLVSTGVYLPRHILVTTLVTLWGIRLSSYMLYRNWGTGEDPRYAELAKDWGTWTLLQSFLKVFMLQGALLWLVSVSIIAINSSLTAGSFRPFDFVAVLIWCIGFGLEVISDWQLHRFLSDELNKGKVLDWGIWRYTRHPNYFGELLMWWSIWLLALPVGSGGITLLSPLTITVIIWLFSIPITENHMAANPAYEDYKKRTSTLIPWTPKKVS